MHENVICNVSWKQATQIKNSNQILRNKFFIKKLTKKYYSKLLKNIQNIEKLGIFK